MQRLSSLKDKVADWFFDTVMIDGDEGVTIKTLKLLVIVPFVFFYELGKFLYTLTHDIALEVKDVYGEK